jgi:hypothetical protein
MPQIMDWKQVAARITQANPNLDPGTFFQAMDMAMKSLANPQMALAYKLETIGMREQMLAQRQYEFERKQAGVESELASRATARSPEGKAAVIEATAAPKAAAIATGAEARAGATTLSKLTQQEAAINSYENTAKKNGQVLLQLGSKVDRTGVPVIERWIRAGRQASGDPEVAQFHAQLTAYLPEVARILSNPNLAGVLTNKARAEVEKMIPENISAKQLQAVIPLIEQDMDRRKESLAAEIARVRGELQGMSKSGGKLPAASPTAPPGDGEGWQEIKPGIRIREIPSGGSGASPFDNRPLSGADKQSMTHGPEQPNTAQPYLEAAQRFASGGLQRALDLPNNVVGRALQNPDNVAAMGMAEKLSTNIGRGGWHEATKNFWTESKVNKLKEGLAAGKSSRELAPELNATKNEVLTHMRRLGLKSSATSATTYKPLPPEIRQQRLQERRKRDILAVSERRRNARELKDKGFTQLPDGTFQRIVGAEEALADYLRLIGK